jgi:hypothetical protein
MTNFIETWTDGYLAVKQRAYETRGFIELDSGARWPRTTGEDAITIAALFDGALNQHATPGTAARWAATLADLEVEAVPFPQSTYFANRTFWSTLEVAAIYLDSVAATVPAQPIWNALIAAVGANAVRNGGPSGDGPFKHFDGVKTFDDLYIEQFKYLRQLRGSDKMQPEAGQGGGERPIPRTTNADVIALADYWSKQLASAKHVMGHEGVAKDWQAAVADIDALARKGEPNAVYPKNNAFWHVLARTAIQIAVAEEAPSSWDLAKEALKDSVTHLPENVKHAASEGADLVASAAHAVGKVASEAGKGLFAGFGTPLLVGAGLLGLFLISRNRGEAKEA